MQLRDVIVSVTLLALSAVNVRVSSGDNMGGPRRRRQGHPGSDNDPVSSVAKDDDPRESDNDMTSASLSWSLSAIGCGADWSQTSGPAAADTDYYSSSDDPAPRVLAGIDHDVFGTDDVIVTTYYGRVRGRRVPGVRDAGK